MPDHVTQFESWAVLSVHVLAPARTNKTSKNENARMRDVTQIRPHEKQNLHIRAHIVQY